MEKIIVYKPEFENQIQMIVDILFEKEYFGFLESAMDYGEKIYDFIFENIDLPISRKTPISHQKFGKYYLKYKVNHHTTWYIFFDKMDEKYIVNHILNNHSKDFPELL